MQSLSTSLLINNRRCVVVGSNSEALAQVNWLCEHNAQVTLIGSATVDQPGVICIDREPVETDIDDCWLVIAASDNKTTNHQLRNWSEARCCFCHSVDDPDSSWQINPARVNSPNVALVGAGPGDPELLTLRALRLIQQADVIVYDRLVSKAIMDRCNQNAEFIYAGKAKSDHTLQQETINQLLVKLALRPANVVRLKGGDPFIFGRGGEELETLSEHQIPFEVVPGITAASGCAAFAGIPLTHRDYAQSCAFVTGHLQNGDINLDWRGLVQPQQTVVVYMGLTGLELICSSLIRHGRSPQTPAALIQQGTQPQQKVFASTLEELPALVKASEVRAPTLMIIGDVVRLRERLDWFV